MKAQGGRTMYHPSGQIGSPSVVDLFAGPGGLGEGFRQAGFFISGPAENDEHAYKTPSFNDGARGTIGIKNNIKRVKISRKADGVVGGPPTERITQNGTPNSN